MTTTTLSTIKPDQQQIVAELQSVLANKNAWRDLVQSSTGQTIIEMIAAIGAYDQYAIEQAYHQSFLDTALTDSAIYAIARMLGVRLPRKNPASLRAGLTRASSVSAMVIPAYSQFSVGSVSLFNRETITIDAGIDTVYVDLYEGQVKSLQLFATGLDFQMFKSSEVGFQVADQDVQVSVNGTPITVSYKGIWNDPNSPVVSDSTTKDGELLLTFGNDEFGYRPAPNASVNVTYVVTKGADGANSSLVGSKVTYLADPTFNGLVEAGGLTGGGNELTTKTMQQISPLLYSAQNTKATTEDEFSAIAAQYPGVYDALVVGQHKVAPTDPRFSNVARVTLLTDTPMTSGQWNDFVDWYSKRTMFPVRYYRQDPIALNQTVTANVYCNNTADLTSVEANINAALATLFAKRINYLGFNIYRSDIYETIMACDSHIVYIELLSPTSDILVDITAPASLQLSAAGGSLPAGQYTYGVTALSATGESLVTNFTTITTTSTGGVLLVWNFVPGATGYRIYGRTPLSQGLMYNHGPNVNSQTDNGAVTPSGALPAMDTSGVHYANLNTVNLTMLYTQRGFNTNV